MPVLLYISYLAPIPACRNLRINFTITSNDVPIDKQKG